MIHNKCRMVVIFYQVEFLAVFSGLISCSDWGRLFVKQYVEPRQRRARCPAIHITSDPDTNITTCLVCYAISSCTLPAMITLLAV